MSFPQRDFILSGFICWLISVPSIILRAQEKVILFENVFSGKKVVLRAGDEVHLRFTVHDTADAPFDVSVADVTVFGTVEQVFDSAVHLATKNKWFDRASVVVPLRSIAAFRKYSPMRPVVKAASVIGASAAGLLATIQISSSDDVMSWGNAGLAAVAGSFIYMSRHPFSDKMKYFASEGWRPRVISATYR